MIELKDIKNDHKAVYLSGMYIGQLQIINNQWRIALSDLHGCLVHSSDSLRLIADKLEELNNTLKTK